MFGFFTRRRRRRLALAPLAPGWLQILEEHVPFYARLRPGLEQRLLADLKVFAAEKVFVGVKGLELTDIHRVVISAVAVRLTLHLDVSYYDALTEIVVYPYDYKHPDGDDMILGEAHNFGTVVLSWPAVMRGLQNPCDGHDTALHEFAHVLDRGSGTFNGTPNLRASEDYRSWGEVLTRHYDRLRKNKRRERKVLRMYGATNEAEFFAVATESFFEKPVQMKKYTPDLYEELQHFYGFDPAENPLCPR